MEMFDSADKIVEAVSNEDDIVKRKAAIKALVGFATHEKEWMTSSIGDKGLAGKVTVSLLFIAISNMGKPKGGS